MKRIINIMICLILLSLSGCILVKPKTLDFGSNETTKSFTLTVIGDFEWSINYSESWLTVEPDNGQGTDTITVTVDRAGLDDGSYEATLNISTNPNIPCPDVIVKMIVGEVTTSTTTPSTTTTPPVPPTTTTTTIGPDPHVLSVFIDYDWDKNGVCQGSTACITIENRGVAGQVYVSASTYGEKHCEVFYMNSNEKQSVCIDLDGCPSESDLFVSARAAEPSDIAGTECNLPPKSVIKSPPDNSVYEEGESILFSGEATDPEDGTLTGNSLVWTSSIDGQIGIGTSFTIDNFTIGMRTITLTVTDSNGKEAKDGIMINIIEDVQDGEKIWESVPLWGSGVDPTVYGDYLYVGKYCLDAQTGVKIWECEMNSVKRLDPSVVSNGYVYASNDSIQGKVFCLNAQTGEIIWEYEIPGSKSASYIAVSNGYVYTCSSGIIFDEGDERLFCLNALSGKKVWEFETGGGLGGYSPVVYEGNIYFITNWKVYCLNAQTGDKVWESGTAIYGYHAPAVSEGFVYVGSHKLYCLNAKTGDKIWDFEVSGQTVSSPSVSDGYVYVRVENSENYLYCISAQTGQKVWVSETGIGRWVPSPVLSDKYVYVASREYLSSFDAKTGELIWHYKIESSRPVVSDGFIYTCSNDDKIYCIKAPDDETGSWPMYRYNPARTGAK